MKIVFRIRVKLINLMTNGRLTHKWMEKKKNPTKALIRMEAFVQSIVKIGN